MQTLAPLQAEAGIDIRIPSPDHMPDPLLILENLSAGYTDDAGRPVHILRDVTLMVRAGSRVGILGANGAGKSTLVKTLAETLPVRAGERRASRGLSIGYFAQHQLDMLDINATPLAAPGAYRAGHARTGTAQLPGRVRLFRRCRDGARWAHVGRRKRRGWRLSLIVWQKPNLLLLDEPSNHLDVETREALAAALAEFARQHAAGLARPPSAAHRRWTSFWIVADGTVHEFDGDLEDYRDWLTRPQRGRKGRSRRAPRLRDTPPPADREAAAPPGSPNSGSVSLPRASRWRRSWPR